MPTAVAVRDAVIAQLGQLMPPVGQPPTSDKPVRTLQRYVGAEFQVKEGMKRGIAGRTPALRVRWAGTRSIRGTIKSRRKRVETAISVVVASDSHRSKDDRDVTPLAETVQKLVSGRRFGLSMAPMSWNRTNTLRDEEDLLALEVLFTTRYWVDNTIDPGADLLLSADGQVVGVPFGDELVGPTAPTFTVNGVPGSARYGYDLQVQYADRITEFSPWLAVHNAPDALGGSNTIGVSWPAYPGAIAYVLRRRWSPAGGPAPGVIYTGTATSFTDNGIVAGDGNTAPVHGVSIEETF
jgi:hypothetical protein